MVDQHHSKLSLSIQYWPIVLLRLYAGVFFTYHGIMKLTHAGFSDRMAVFLQSRLESSFGFYQEFINSVILPNKELFGFLVTWGELTMGIALILGLATRYAAFAGVFMITNIWFAKGQGLLVGTNGDLPWIVILLVLGLIPAGKICGLDARLSDNFRFPG